MQHVNQEVTKLVNESQYQVTNADDNVTIWPRRMIHYRKQNSFAFCHASDNKTYDRFSRQHHATTQLDYLEEHMRANLPNDLVDGHIVKLHQHSDNESQNFKSVGSMHYFTSLINRAVGALKTSGDYTLGELGHIKELFDGVGGMRKKKSTV